MVVTLLCGSVRALCKAVTDFKLIYVIYREMNVKFIVFYTLGTTYIIFTQFREYINRRE